MPSERRTLNPRMLLLPLVAFLAVLPLILNGCSCGHDFTFHLQNWLEAAAQFRAGHLHPHWVTTAAWNAGEPRFVFYPPISWTLGGLLALAVPFAAMPALFTWIALTASAVTMYRLAREFVSANAALMAATVYIVNPYMLFTAYERTAYAELLAAAWLPLLMLAALRTRLSVPRIAVPIALLWLTNAPAAVMGCYTFAVVIAVRLVQDLRTKKSPKDTLVRALGGTALGLALPAFYLVPAAYERHYVQIAMAVIANMRFQDNFLFGHTGDAPHDRVLHTATLIAVGLVVMTAACLTLAYQRRGEERGALVPLSLLTGAIAFLLTSFSTPLWNHLPELSFLQFPWRLLAVLGVVFALGVALLFNRLRISNAAVAVSVTAIALAFSQVEIKKFRQGCGLYDRPVARAVLFVTGHGVDPTDEYTPTEADNDFLRTNDADYWLADSAQAFAPGTTPNPAATIVNYDVPPPLDQTVSTPVPHHFMVNPKSAQVLVLNLRDYPNWRITRTSLDESIRTVSERLQRDDGLVAFHVPQGPSTIDITWRRSFDQVVGDLLTLVALIMLCVLGFHFRGQRETRKLEAA